MDAPTGAQRVAMNFAMHAEFGCGAVCMYVCMYVCMLMQVRGNTLYKEKDPNIFNF